MVYQNDELLVHYQPKPEENRTSIPGRKVLPVPQWALRCRRDFSPWRTMCWTTPHIQANEGDEEIGHEYAYLFWNMPDGMYRVDENTDSIAS